MKPPVEPCVPARRIAVAFGGERVVIETDAPGLRSHILHDFGAMLAAGPVSDEAEADLVVRRTAHGYGLWRAAQLRHPSLSPAETWHVLRREIIHALIDTRRDLLWMHAGAVSFGGRAVLLPAPSGGGKSTLVTALCEQGCGYLSDDLVPIAPCTDRVLPFPLTPRVRRRPEAPLPHHRLWELRREHIDLAPEAVCPVPLPIGLLLLPAFDFGAPAQLGVQPPAQVALELLQRCVNFDVHREGAVAYLSRLAERLPCRRVVFSDGPAAARHIMEALAEGALPPA